MNDLYQKYCRWLLAKKQEKLTENKKKDREYSTYTKIRYAKQSHRAQRRDRK